MSTPSIHLLLRRLAKIKEWVDTHDPGSLIIPFSAVFENKIFDMPPDEKEAYLKEVNATRYSVRLI